MNVTKMFIKFKLRFYNDYKEVITKNVNKCKDIFIKNKRFFHNCFAYLWKRKKWVKIVNCWVFFFGFIIRKIIWIEKKKQI